MRRLLDDSHAQLVRLAQMEAQRRRHVATAPEHLLGVVLEVRSEADAVHARGLDPFELRDRAATALADLPVAGGYRDAAEAPVSPAITRALARCSGRIRFVVRRRPRLVEALLLEPAVAALVVGLRRGADHRYVIERARALGIVASHGVVGLEHVFSALLDLPSFVATLQRAGGAREELATFVNDSLRAPRPALSEFPSCDAAMTQLLGSIADPLSLRQFCIKLARVDESEAFWRAAGVSRAAFLHAVHVPS